jgi:hypothetical protein
MPDTLSSKTRAGGPFGVGNAYLEDSAVPLATLQMQNQNATRNRPINPALASALQDAVTRTYGSGYTVSVMSGAQPAGPRGTPGTTGSRRHGTGDAADIVVRDPAGKSLTPNQLLPLARQWLASDTGSVGFPADGTNFLHLDLVGGSGNGAIPLPKGEGRLWYYGTPDKLQQQELTAALNGVAPPLPPMNIPDVATDLAYVPDAPEPGTLNSALQAIQQNTAPSDWAGFYSDLLPAANPPRLPSDYAQLTTPQAVSDFYSGFGLQPAGGPPPLPDYAQITTPQQANDFYSGFGLAPAGNPPPLPGEATIATPQQVSDFYAGFGLAPASLPPEVPTIRTAQDAANFYDGFGLSPAASSQVAGTDNSVPPSILPSTWPQLPPSFSTSPDQAVGDRAAQLAAATPPSVLPSTWPSLPPSLSISPDASVADRADQLQSALTAPALSSTWPALPLPLPASTPSLSSSAPPIPMDRLRVAPGDVVDKVKQIAAGSRVNLDAVPPDQQTALVYALPGLIGMPAGQDGDIDRLKYLQATGLMDPLLKVVPTQQVDPLTRTLGSMKYGIPIPPVVPSDFQNWGIRASASDLIPAFESAYDLDAYRRPISDSDGVQPATSSSIMPPSVLPSSWPAIPSVAPSSLPSRSTTSNPLASLFASSVPASLTAPTLNSAMAFGQSPMTTDSFSAGSGGLPSIWPTLPTAAPSLPAAASSSYSSQSLTPGADLTSLSIPQSVSVPKYITVSRQVPVPASQPLETGSGVHWDASQNNFVLDDTPAAPAATQYKTVSERVLNPAYTTSPAAAPPMAVMPQPVTPLSPPQSELAALREAQMNPLQRLFNMTPAGHVMNFLNGSAAAYGAPQTGGILQAIARANGSNPLASLFGLGGASPTPAATSSLPTAAFGVNQLGQALNSSTRTPALAAGATGTAGGYIYQSNGDGTYTNIGRAPNWSNGVSNSGDGSMRSLTED